MAATLRPREGGGTRIEVHWERTPTSFVDKFAARLIVLTKGKPIAASLEKALRKLEASGQTASA